MSSEAADTFAAGEQMLETVSDKGRYSLQAVGALDIRSEGHIARLQPAVADLATPSEEGEGRRGPDMVVSAGVAERIVTVMRAVGARPKPLSTPDSSRLQHLGHLVQVFVAWVLARRSNLAVVSAAVDVACQKP